jgi:hypothetical protein
MIAFTVFYITMSWVFLPKILKIVKMRKQKVDFLTKMDWLYSSRLKQWSLSHAFSVSVISNFVHSFLKKNTSVISKKGK